MTTVSAAIATLQKLADAGHSDLEIVGRHGGSGVTYETGSLFLAEKKNSDDCGSLCDERDGYKYIALYLGN